MLIDGVSFDYDPVLRPKTGCGLVIGTDGSIAAIATDTKQENLAMEADLGDGKVETEVFKKILAFLAGKLDNESLKDFRALLEDVGLGHPLKADPGNPDQAQDRAPLFDPYTGRRRPIPMTAAQEADFAKRFPDAARLKSF